MLYNVDSFKLSLLDRGGFVWKWNLIEAEQIASYHRSEFPINYDDLCPRGTTFDLRQIVTNQNIMLESQSCTPVPMEILQCTCFKTRVFDSYGNKATENTFFDFVRGPNGEVYVVSSPGNDTKCNDAKTMIIKGYHDGNFIDTSFTIHDVSETEHFLLHGSS